MRWRTSMQGGLPGLEVAVALGVKKVALSVVIVEKDCVTVVGFTVVGGAETEAASETGYVGTLHVPEIRHAATAASCIFCVLKKCMIAGVCECVSVVLLSSCLQF